MTELGGRTERGGVTTHFNGEVTTVGVENKGIDNKIREIIKAKEVEGKQGYIFMDVDGCLIEGGLETAGNVKTLEQWTEENKENISNFRNNIKRLKENGFNVGLCTGRGLDFSKKLIDIFFPEDGGIKIDKSVVEGGLLIYDDSTNSYEVAPAVDQKSAEVLKENRNKIMEVGINFGASVEEGKQLAVSFNPPINGEGKRNTDDFRERMKVALDPTLVNELVITNSSSAVDITPKGVDKLTALRGVIGDGMVVYIGDGKNDETAMNGSNVEINLTPSNSHPDIKDFIKTTDNKIGLIASKPDIEGVNKTLLLINAVQKLYKKKIN